MTFTSCFGSATTLAVAVYFKAVGRVDGTKTGKDTHTVELKFLLLGF